MNNRPLNRGARLVHASRYKKGEGKFNCLDDARTLRAIEKRESQKLQREKSLAQFRRVLTPQHGGHNVTQPTSSVKKYTKEEMKELGKLRYQEMLKWRERKRRVLEKEKERRKPNFTTGVYHPEKAKYLSGSDTEDVLLNKGTPLKFTPGVSSMRKRTPCAPAQWRPATSVSKPLRFRTGVTPQGPSAVNPPRGNFKENKSVRGRVATPGRRRPATRSSRQFRPPPDLGVKPLPITPVPQGPRRPQRRERSFAPPNFSFQAPEGISSFPLGMDKVFPFVTSSRRPPSPVAMVTESATDSPLAEGGSASSSPFSHNHPLNVSFTIPDEEIPLEKELGGDPDKGILPLEEEIGGSDKGILPLEKLGGGPKERILLEEETCPNKGIHPLEKLGVGPKERTLPLEKELGGPDERIFSPAEDLGSGSDKEILPLEEGSPLKLSDDGILSPEKELGGGSDKGTLPLEQDSPLKLSDDGILSPEKELGSGPDKGILPLEEGSPLKLSDDGEEALSPQAALEVDHKTTEEGLETLKEETPPTGVESTPSPTKELKPGIPEPTTNPSTKGRRSSRRRTQQPTPITPPSLARLRPRTPCSRSTRRSRLAHCDPHVTHGSCGVTPASKRKSTGRRSTRISRTLVPIPLDNLMESSPPIVVSTPEVDFYPKDSQVNHPKIDYTEVDHPEANLHSKVDLHPEGDLQSSLQGKEEKMFQRRMAVLEDSPWITRSRGSSGSKGKSRREKRHLETPLSSDLKFDGSPALNRYGNGNASPELKTAVTFSSNLEERSEDPALSRYGNGNASPLPKTAVTVTSNLEERSVDLTAYLQPSVTVPVTPEAFVWGANSRGNTPMEGYAEEPPEGAFLKDETEPLNNPLAEIPSDSTEVKGPQRRSRKRASVSFAPTPTDEDVPAQMISQLRHQKFPVTPIRKSTRLSMGLLAKDGLIPCPSEAPEENSSPLDVSTSGCKGRMSLLPGLPPLEEGGRGRAPGSPQVTVPEGTDLISWESPVVTPARGRRSRIPRTATPMRRSTRLSSAQ